MIFQPGTYYVGDPGFVLPSDDLRQLFSMHMRKNFKTGFYQVVASRCMIDTKEICDAYWFCVTPNGYGTLYDKDNKGWGYDWGCFGVVPWKWTVNTENSYLDHKINFKEPFTCFSNNEGFSIGHLNFTFNPK